MLTLKNPHSVLAAMEARPKDVVSVSLSGGSSGGDDDAWAKVAKRAQSLGIRTQAPQRGGGGRRDSSPDGGRTGQFEAQVKERAGVEPEELFLGAAQKDGGKGLWLALDSLTDPHNVGAIFRAASFFGVSGIVLTAERSAPMSATVYDVACGGVEDVPFSQVANLQRAFEKAKEAGLWILGTTEHQGDPLSAITRDRPWLLVLGNEEKGMRRLTEESCDLLCRIPSRGKVTSLNVSVAAGICIASLAPAR